MQSSSEQPLVGEEHCVTILITAAKETRVPGEKPYVTSDKLPDSPSKFPCIQL